LHLAITRNTTGADFTSCGSNLIGGKIRHLPEVMSTNDLLKVEAEEGIAQPGEILITEHQTAGRGRLDRLWESPPGKSLLFSMLLNPDIPGLKLQLMGLLTSLGILDGLTAYLGENEVQPERFTQALRLKWPNDIMVGRRKLCGILSDAGLDNRDRAFVVVGVGVNINQSSADFPEALRNAATSLYIMTGHEQDRVRLFRSFIQHIDRYFERLIKEGDGWIPSIWLKRAGIAGTKVECCENARTIRGRCHGISPDGALELEMPDGTIRTFYSGDFT
jgi:BirA family biotin operon repressor/biotin-[acetyl-CoA-carboxylase] ligase